MCGRVSLSSSTMSRAAESEEGNSRCLAHAFLRLPRPEQLLRCWFLSSHQVSERQSMDTCFRRSKKFARVPDWGVRSTYPRMTDCRRIVALAGCRRLCVITIFLPLVVLEWALESDAVSTGTLLLEISLLSALISTIGKSVSSSSSVQGSLVRVHGLCGRHNSGVFGEDAVRDRFCHYFTPSRAVGVDAPHRFPGAPARFQLTQSECHKLAVRGSPSSIADHHYRSRRL